jgi:uncharacterized protein (TIGR02246 family)
VSHVRPSGDTAAAVAARARPADERLTGARAPAYAVRPPDRRAAMRMTPLLAATLLMLAPLTLSAHNHGGAEAREDAAAHDDAALHDHAAMGHGHGRPLESAADCWLPAFKAGDADAVAACYVDDAVMIFPDGPLAQGRPAIRDGYAHFFADYSIKDVQLEELGREAHGNSVTVWGRFAITMSPKAGGADVVARGRFSEMSRKVDGQWRYVFDHASDDPPPPPAPAAAATPAGG